MKLQPLWRSRVNNKVKLHVYHAVVVSTLLYGLDSLTLEMKHLKTIDAWYHQHLRRCMGIKASYYSHITNRSFWEQANKPTVSSQKLLSLQLQQLAKTLITPPTNPTHHVVFSPGIKDRVKFTKGLKRGHPQRYWLEVVEESALLVFNDYLRATNQVHRSDLLGLKQYLTNNPEYALHLAAAPTRQPNIFKRHGKSLGCAWQP